MSVEYQNGLNWLSDIHTVVDVLIFLVMGFSAFIGYRVHLFLFNMKIPETLAVHENEIKNLNDRVKNLEAHTYGTGGSKS